MEGVELKEEWQDEDFPRYVGKPPPAAARLALRCCCCCCCCSLLSHMMDHRMSDLLPCPRHVPGPCRRRRTWTMSCSGERLGTGILVNLETRRAAAWH